MQYFGGTFQCGILAVFWRYFSVFKTTDTVPIPRYLEKNTAYRHRTDFFPTAGHCMETIFQVSMETILLQVSMETIF